MTKKETLARQVINGLESQPKTLELSTSGEKVYDNSTLQPITGTDTIRPHDLTGIGIKTSEWLDDRRNPLCVIHHDLNTLQMYHEKDTLFKFLHILTSKLKSNGTTFICIQTTIDESGPNPLTSLFDYIITTSETTDGTPEYTIQKDTSLGELSLEDE